MNVKRLWVLVSLVAVVVFFNNNFCFARNITPSLPQKYWIIAKGKKPKRGDYICFTLSEETAKKNNLCGRNAWRSMITNHWQIL